METPWDNYFPPILSTGEVHYKYPIYSFSNGYLQYNTVTGSRRNGSSAEQSREMNSSQQTHIPMSEFNRVDNTPLTNWLTCSVKYNVPNGMCTI